MKIIIFLDDWNLYVHKKSELCISAARKSRSLRTDISNYKVASLVEKKLYYKFYKLFPLQIRVSDVIDEPFKNL